MRKIKRSRVLPQENRTVLGNNIRTRRELQKLNVVQLAKKAQISAQQVYSIESGKNAPSIFVYLQLCRALGVPLPLLFRPPGHSGIGI